MVELLWITKTPTSKSLSHSDGQEQLEILSQAQRTSRREKAARLKKLKAATTAVKSRNKTSSKSLPTKSHSSPNDSGYASQSDGDSSPPARWSPPLLESFLEKDPHWTLAERRSATYFQEVAVHKILTLKRDKTFWKELVPFCAESHAGIRHLVVAIAATYELLFRPDSDALNRFALEQCNKAIGCMLSSDATNLLVLITSCILVSAYNLLRCDVQAADRSIDSGLKMSDSSQVKHGDANIKHVSGILTSLGKQHGFKLWAPDVTFRIDRTVAGREVLNLEPAFPKGPFLNAADVLDAFKTAIVENVAKPLRNLALGVHIDPNCLWARHVAQNFSEIFFHWDAYYRSLSDEQADEKLQLVQLKIGLLNARILFHTKVTESNENHDNKYVQSYAEIARLGKEVISARHANRRVIYLDRIVNGALYTSSLFCRDPQIKRDLISLLKSQVVYADGLVNFMRGHVAEIQASIEEDGLVVNTCYDIPREQRIGISLLDCQEDRTLYIQYMQVTQTDRQHSALHSSRLPSELNRFTAQEIDDCLKGMTAAYTMYRKVDLCTAPEGYLRSMSYLGRPVRIVWREDLVDSHQI